LERRSLAMVVCTAPLSNDGTPLSDPALNFRVFRSGEDNALINTDLGWLITQSHMLVAQPD
jgi:hypothetical protein